MERQFSSSRRAGIGGGTARQRPSQPSAEEQAETRSKRATAARQRGERPSRRWSEPELARGRKRTQEARTRPRSATKSVRRRSSPSVHYGDRYSNFTSNSGTREPTKNLLKKLRTVNQQNNWKKRQLPWQLLLWVYTMALPAYFVVTTHSSLATHGSLLLFDGLSDLALRAHDRLRGGAPILAVEEEEDEALQSLRGGYYGYSPATFLSILPIEDGDGGDEAARARPQRRSFSRLLEYAPKSTQQPLASFLASSAYYLRGTSTSTADEEKELQQLSYSYN